MDPEVVSAPKAGPEGGPKNRVSNKTKLNFLNIVFPLFKKIERLYFLFALFIGILSKNIKKNYEVLYPIPLNFK